MTKTPVTPNPGYRLCPTCGSRVGASAAKCLVCGSDLGTGPVPAAGNKPAPAPASALTRRPTSLTTVLIILVLIALVLGGGVMLAAASGIAPGIFNRSTATVTATSTPPPTLTFTPTSTETPVPTDTPLPLLDYTVQSGDTCIKIAINSNVSVASIITANNGLINADCSNLSVGTVLKVPQPTPTPSPLPSATLSKLLDTPVPRLTHIIKSGENLAGIAKFYGLTIADLMQVNGIQDAGNIRAGEVLVIPLERVRTPGPTPTVTSPPPYPAPQQLNPRDGEIFLNVETVTLQWAAVSQLRAGEAYQVIVEDVTANAARILRDQVTDSKFILPATFQPQGGQPHVYRWAVTTVRQRLGTDPNQPPVYDSAGLTSPQRSFVWSAPAAGATPTAPAAPSATP